ncbi:MAG TPA: nucleoside triphosphate pyrophosphohydrolase [Candidatus Bathyarchaeia archaeon]|nr:nucleoside triphosphate pyrophosphohydrolase [Candidatus Bathyarchaeia archaeon]
MTRYEYDKLVRNKIPEIIKSEGKIAEVRIAKNNEELLIYLGKKLVEEAIEYSENKDITELVDILEVIFEIIKINNITYKELDNLRNRKMLERGSFTKKTILLAVKDK